MKFNRAYLALSVAFLLWGMFPIYFRYMKPLRADEFLFARIIMSVVTLLLFFVVTGRWWRVVRDFLSPGMIVRCAITAVFLGINWFTYIWAVQNDQTLQASLGYYITPIINILFGLWLFSERMSRLQWAAVFCAFAGVAYQLIMLGVMPWASLLIASAWGIYGGIRKKFHIAPVTGMFNELIILMPIALLGLGGLYLMGEGFDYSGEPWLLIAVLLSGVATIVPLILFLYAVMHLPMNTVGIMQYLTPSIQFCIAVFLFHEPFDKHRLISFLLIWVGLGLYSMHLLANGKERKYVKN